MTISLSPEQVGVALSGTIGLVGWIFIQWKKDADAYKSLHLNFSKLVRDEAKAMSDVVDAELKVLYARIELINKSMQTIVEKIAIAKNSHSISQIEFDALEQELNIVEAELNAVLARASAVKRRKHETNIILKELSADTFDMKKYEASRLDFERRTPVSPPIQLRLQKPERNPRLGMTTVEIRAKLSSIEGRIKSLQALSDASPNP